MSVEHNETVLEIAAEFRQMNEVSVGGIIAVNANVIADRLEAAAKRDAEVIADLRNRVRLWTERADELRQKCDELYAKANLARMGRMGDSKDTLGDRMKQYEAMSTSRQLMPNCPVYARIDGRAFHTLCKGLKKPYSMAFIDTMKEVCKYLVGETGAVLGYVQSDEISLGWIDYSKAPFEGRVQKLESVLASMASAKFVQYVESSKSGGLHVNDGVNRLWDRCNMYLPSFDCRIFNVPSLMELANAFLWRENDAIKNSITGMALNFFSHKQIQNKSGEEKIAMMKDKDYDFYSDTEPSFMRGTFYHREHYEKVLTDEEVARIPESQRINLFHHVETQNGEIVCDEWSCIRSHIVQMNLPYRLTDTFDIDKVLFFGMLPECNKDNPTFCITDANP